MIKLESRYYKALAVAVGIHIMAAGVLGMYAWLPSPQKDKILEVTLAGAPKKKGVKKPAVTPKPKPKPVRIKPKKDDIVDKKLKEEKPQEETKEMPEPEEVDNTAVGEEGDPNGSEEGTTEGNGGQEGTAVQLPYITYKTEPSYPEECRKNRQEGTVLLKVLVGEDGRVLEVNVASSSGFALLDNSALRTVYKWRFSPARDAKKQKVKCYVNLPIIFKLK